MNKDYYELVFGTDMKKQFVLRISNALETFDITDFENDMNAMIQQDMFVSKNGTPTISRLVRFISPFKINIAVA